MTPEDSHLTGRVTPEDANLTGGVTPEDDHLTGGVTPEDAHLTGRVTPEDANLTGGVTPEDAHLTGGVTPELRGGAVGTGHSQPMPAPLGGGFAKLQQPGVLSQLVGTSRTTWRKTHQVTVNQKTRGSNTAEVVIYNPRDHKSQQ